MKKGVTKFIFTHHAEKVVWGENKADEAENYPMITRRGEAQTREKAKTLVGVVNDMPAGSVLILGGASEVARTQSTLAVYTDELRKLLPGRREIIFVPFQIAEFISASDQPRENIARGILAGLEREEAFFRRFFPDKQITLFNVGHSIEISALVAYLLERKNGKFEQEASFSSFSFSFM